MRHFTWLAVTAVTLALGCQLVPHWSARKVPPPAPPTYSQYHLDGWSWAAVGRVLVLPLANESDFTRAGDEVRTALTSELQQLGRFEVVASAPDDRAVLAAGVRASGRFDEATALDLGRSARADVVVFGAVTQYSPYPRPRLGLVLQAVAPAEAKVVASVDGLWDTSDCVIAERVRSYYRQRPRPRPPWIRNNVIIEDDGFAGELALDSPALFQRYVAYEAAWTLVGLPVRGVVVDGVAPPVVGR